MNRDEENTDSPTSDICVKTYAQGQHTLVAACDLELLGETLTDGDLTFEVSTAFYDGVRGDLSLLKRHLRAASTANLVGERCVACGKRLGLIDREKVLNIGSVPHAQFVLMP